MSKKPENITLPAYKTAPPYGGSTLDWWLFFIRPHSWGLGFYFILNTARQTFFQAQPLFFGLLVGMVENESIVENTTSLLYWGAGYIVLSLFVYATIYVVVPSGLIMDRISKEVSLFGFRHYMALSESWHENRASGEKLQRLTSARQGIFRLIIDAFWRIGPMPGAIIAVTISMIALDASFIYTLMFTGMSITYIAVSFWTGNWMIDKFAHFNKTREDVIGGVYEFIVSTTTMRFFNLKNHAMKKARELEYPNHLARQSILSKASMRWFLINCSVLFWIMSIISYALYDVSYNDLSIAAFTAIIFFILPIWWTLEPIALAYVDLVESWEEFKRLTQVLNEKPDIEDDPNAVALKTTTPQIDFNHVRFHYQQGKSIIDDLSLTIQPGEKIGLLGPSGAGKSTIVKLLMRFYDVEDGAITIDGQNLKHVTRESVQENIAVIPQDPVLFNHPLIENIRYGDLTASDEQVFEAARKAHADDFIHDLPEGYNTLVGERGVKLSGGQRQRIAIARAILKNAPILILDEATSALDSESEKYIQTALKSLMDGKTVIAIAHRLSTISHLDRLIVMDQGQMIEQGSHEELLHKDGLYAKLWSMQSGGFICPDI